MCMCVNVLGEEINATKACETPCADCADFKTVYLTGNSGSYILKLFY